jgi:hypothetical protein
MYTSLTHSQSCSASLTYLRPLSFGTQSLAIAYWSFPGCRTSHSNLFVSLGRGAKSQHFNLKPTFSINQAILSWSHAQCSSALRPQMYSSLPHEDRFRGFVGWEFMRERICKLSVPAWLLAIVLPLSLSIMEGNKSMTDGLDATVCENHCHPPNSAHLWPPKRENIAQLKRPACWAAKQWDCLSAIARSKKWSWMEGECFRFWSTPNTWLGVRRDPVADAFLFVLSFRFLVLTVDRIFLLGIGAGSSPSPT